MELQGHLTKKSSRPPSAAAEPGVRCLSSVQRVINSNLIIAESFISCRSLVFFCFDGFLVSCHKHGFVCIVSFLVLCRWRSSQIKTHHFQCNTRTGIVTFSADSAGRFQQVCKFLVSGSMVKFILAHNILVQCQFASSKFLSTGA